MRAKLLQFQSWVESTRLSTRYASASEGGFKRVKSTVALTHTGTEIHTLTVRTRLLYSSSFLLEFGVGFRLTFALQHATCPRVLLLLLLLLPFCPVWNQVFELTLTNKANCWHVDGLSTISFLLPATSARKWQSVITHCAVLIRVPLPFLLLLLPWLSLGFI